MSQARTLRRFAVVTLLLLAFGFSRLQWETRLTHEHQSADFGNVKFNLGLRARIGQLGFLAALSGFRSLVADLLWIDAYTAWEKVEYGRMNFIFQTVTTLAPHNVNFWQLASWHMAYNASVAAMQDKKQPSFVRRKMAQHEYFIVGKDYLEQGIINNPKSYVLYEHLGALYRDKLEDHWNASLAYDKAKDAPDAPAYEKRFAAYELSKCPGHEREAWKLLRALYDMGPQERLPTLETDLRAMEKKLQLPAEQRVPAPKASAAPYSPYKLPLPEEQRVYKGP